MFSFSFVGRGSRHQAAPSVANGELQDFVFIRCVELKKNWNVTKSGFASHPSGETNHPYLIRSGLSKNSQHSRNNGIDVYVKNYFLLRFYYIIQVLNRCRVARQNIVYNRYTVC